MSKLIRKPVAALVLASLAACSPGGADPVSGSGDQTGKNRSSWVMPLDVYMVDQQLDHAVDVLVEPCMRESGFVFERPGVDPTKRSETVTVSGRHLFNVDVARRWGYSGAPDPNGDVLRSFDAQLEGWSPEQYETYEACLQAARAEFPAQSINDFVAGLSLSSWSGATRAPEVLDAAAAWAECMRPLGFTDLPDSPHGEDGGTPTPSMSDAYGEIADGISNVQTAAQEAEEIRIATFDAECQERSGYAQALYEAEWARQVGIVRDNEAALATLLEEKIAYEERADAIFRQSGMASG